MISFTGNYGFINILNVVENLIFFDDYFWSLLYLSSNSPRPSVDMWEFAWELPFRLLVLAILIVYVCMSLSPLAKSFNRVPSFMTNPSRGPTEKVLNWLTNFIEHTLKQKTLAIKVDYYWQNFCKHVEENFQRNC